MSNSKCIWIIFLFGAGLTLIAAGLPPLMIAYAQDTEPVTTVEPTPEVTLEPIYQIAPPPEVTGNNSYCMVCHNQPWHSVTLGDGTIQNLYVNTRTIAASVHGESNQAGTLGCIDCHGENAFPHNYPSPANGREYTLNSVSICASCHADNARDLEHGLHEEAIRASNREAAVCTDCHGSHDVQAVVEEQELIAGVCGDCHRTTLIEWQNSDHVNIGPLGCATCHSPHSQRLRAGETPDQLCINCHESVEDKFVHQQHNVVEGDVSCIDCHMFTAEQPRQLASELPITDLPTGHSMLLDTTPCTDCHQQLVESGEWATILASRATAPDVIELFSEPVESTTSETAAEPETGITESYIELLQGLILGLGFGVTIAAVLISRGNRLIATQPQTTDSEPNG